MGRDSRGDRYSRPSDTTAPDRHGNVDSNNSSSSATKATSRYGRYAGVRRSRSPRSGRRGVSEGRDKNRHSHRRRSESDERRRRRRGGASGRSRSKDTNKREGRHRSRSRSRSRSSLFSSTDVSRRGESGRQKFEAVDMQELLQPEGLMMTGGTALATPSEMILKLIQQQQLFQQQQQQQATVSGSIMSILDVVPGVEDAAPHDTMNMTNDLPQSQAQDNSHPQEQIPEEEEETEEEIAPKPTAPAKVLPSVEDFVPVIPRSLLNILGAPVADKSDNGGDGGGGVAANAGAAGEEGEEQTGVLTTTTGALAVLQAPILSPEAERRAREARRAHISCFPQRTTRQELLDYFTTIIPMVRHVKVQKEMDLITEQMRAEVGSGEEVERREIPPNAIVDVDRVVDVSVNSTKSKPFAFLEVNLADLVTELVEESQRDPDRFAFIAADGQSYPITIRRPRDYRTLGGVDHRKVVMLGFPPSLPVEKLRLVFENFGTVLNFDLKADMAYAEFEKETDAIDCVQELHGVTLGNNVLVMMPLYDWLKVVCTHAGIDVTLDPDDPVSGASLLAKDGNTCGSLVPTLADDAMRAEEPVDHMKELLELTVSLPDVVLHFARTYPHLATLYGSTVPIFPTRVLVLMNLFDEEELVLDDTHEKLIDEIASEVEKYGRVKSLIVPRRTPPPIPPKPPKSLFVSRMKTTRRTGGGGFCNNNNNNGSGHYPHNINGSAYSTAAPLSGIGTQAHEEERCDHSGVNNYNKDGNDIENGGENERIQYEQAKTEYLKAREEYTDKLMHPIHGGFGRVFVEYETIDEAVMAQRAIAGRLFGGRTVVTSFMFEDVLYPPTVEEVEAQADEKLKLYLEGVGAGSDDEETQEEKGTSGDDAAYEVTAIVEGCEEK